MIIDIGLKSGIIALFFGFCGIISLVPRFFDREINNKITGTLIILTLIFGFVFVSSVLIHVFFII